MNNNYNDEATRYQGSDNEATQFEEISNTEQEANNTTSNDKVQATQTKSAWARTAASAGSGLLIGGAATILMGMKNADSDIETESNNNNGELSHPEWVDDTIQVATTVNDDMSFGEAFAAARTEVGPGGCFEWHGNLYGTYTADEWDNMTSEQRAEWSDHFSWNHIDHSSSDVAPHSTHGSATSESSTAHNQAAETNDDDIDVISVNHPDNQNDLTQAESHQPANQAEVVEVSQADPEIEILGVVHDTETGANIGGMTVDGQEVILIDVDGDMAFDYMAADLNGNGQVDQEDLVDIQGQGLTVNDFGGISNPAGDMLASNEDPYSSDSVYEV